MDFEDDWVVPYQKKELNRGKDKVTCDFKCKENIVYCVASTSANKHSIYSQHMYLLYYIVHSIQSPTFTCTGVHIHI